MDCPKGHGQLESVNVGSIRIDRCTECGGSWYDRGGLRLLKDKEARGDYCWIDFDLWKKTDRFRADKQQRYACPSDGHPMTTVRYGESPVLVDICSECEGAWLDRHEYDLILAYLANTVNTQTVGDYLSDVQEEFIEILTGPEGPISEMNDFARVLYLLQLRLVIERPRLAAFLNSLPRF
jgi:Zn-finger nucleic acid-binding protein